MTENSTQVRGHIRAPRSIVYSALIDAKTIAQWKVPVGMTMQVHEFESREGGAFRISLTYDKPTEAGKTTAHTDTYHGHYVQLIPDEKIVEEDEFETFDPALQGVMTITFSLMDADGGTDLVALHKGIPAGVSTSDNELGWQMALNKLAALLESKIGI